MKLKTILRVGCATIKGLLLKVKNGSNLKLLGLNTASLSTEIRMYKGGKLSIGKHLSAMRRVLISVASEAEIELGNNVNINDNCSIIAKKSIKIGNDVIFGPGCLVYDHDHDFTKMGKERRENFKIGSVKIGDGVWFGANCIVLKDTHIGNNCVFGAGCVIKGEYPDNTLIVQERMENRRLIEFERYSI